jgi:effector-binding domain-containing protein
MAYDFDLRELAPQPTVVMRADVPSAELPAAIGRVLPAVWGYLESRGIMPAGPPFVRYVSFDDQRTSFEGGFSVGAGVSGEGEVESSSLPGGYLAVTTHHGPYDRLIDAYQLAGEWPGVGTLLDRPRRGAGSGEVAYRDLPAGPPAGRPGDMTSC